MSLALRSEHGCVRVCEHEAMDSCAWYRCRRRRSASGIFRIEMFGLCATTPPQTRSHLAAYDIHVLAGAVADKSINSDFYICRHEHPLPRQKGVSNRGRARKHACVLVAGIVPSVCVFICVLSDKRSQHGEPSSPPPFRDSHTRIHTFITLCMRARRHTRTCTPFNG